MTVLGSSLLLFVVVEDDTDLVRGREGEERRKGGGEMRIEISLSHLLISLDGVQQLFANVGEGTAGQKIVKGKLPSLSFIAGEMKKPEIS